MFNVFKLISYVVEGQDQHPLLPKFGKDMTANMYVHEIGLFTTVKGAERFIRPYLKHVAGWNDCIIGFQIVEKTVDEGFASNGEVSGFKSTRAYDGEGRLIAESDLDDECEKRFYGRKKQVPFEKGDVGLVCWGDKAFPALICQLPPTAAWWKAHIKGGNGGDETDDSYTVVTWKNGHDHPRATSVFPFIGRVPAYVRKRLEAEKARYEREFQIKK